ncbi:MAG: ATP-binding protein [Nanoarchaeota archaeon]
MDRQAIEKITKESLEGAKKGDFWKREIFDKALDLMPLRHIISIVGVRRCGKSTLMKALVREVLQRTSEKNILYLNLEHPFFNQYKEHVRYLQEIYDIFRDGIDKRRKVFVFLDEIQFFDDWQVFVKWLYERDEAKIILTGSNSRLLSSELATLLSGRMLPLHMYPFSLQESGLSFDNYMEKGGFPEIVIYPSSQNLLAETYYKNILYQDVIPRFGIQNSRAMENLSFYLISNIGKELSYNTLKSISQLDDKTVKEYVSYLQDANLLFVLHNYDFSLKKLIGNKKKIYIVDPIFTQLSFKNSPDYGRLFENFIYMTLRRLEKDVYFHSNGGECDFLIKEGVKISRAIQVCYEFTPDNEEREIAGLVTALQKFELQEGFIVTHRQNRQKMVSGKKIRIISVSAFLRKFGMDSEN